MQLQLQFTAKHHFKMHKKLILSIITIVIVIILLFLFLENYKNKNSIPLAVDIPSNLTVSAANPNISVTSPDNKSTLTMKKETIKTSVTYTFTTENIIYTKTTTTSDNFSIPFNTWSPDNKYIFLKETDEQTNSFLALNASGVPFKNGSQFINVSDVFKEKLKEFVLKDVTGWAAPTLLILNTNKADGSEGPSFWFDIPSQTFTLLSTRFN